MRVTTAPVGSFKKICPLFPLQTVRNLKFETAGRQSRGQIITGTTSISPRSEDNFTSPTCVVPVRAGKGNNEIKSNGAKPMGTATGVNGSGGWVMGGGGVGGTANVIGVTQHRWFLFFSFYRAGLRGVRARPCYVPGAHRFRWVASPTTTEQLLQCTTSPVLPVPPFPASYSLNFKQHKLNDGT